MKSERGFAKMKLGFFMAVICLLPKAGFTTPSGMGDVVVAIQALSTQMNTLQATIGLSSTLHGDLNHTTGAISATTCAGGGAFFCGGRPMTLSISSAGATGATIYIDVSNAATAPAVTDPLLWRNLIAYMTLQPAGGLAGAVDANVVYVTGYRWVKIRSEVTPQSAVTVNLQSQN